MSEETKKIEWLENVKVGAEQKIAETTDFVSPEGFELYVNDLGWAKCCETGEHAERTPGVHKLNVHNQKTAVSST